MSSTLKRFMQMRGWHQSKNSSDTAGDSEVSETPKPKFTHNPIVGPWSQRAGVYDISDAPLRTYEIRERQNGVGDRWFSVYYLARTFPFFLKRWYPFCSYHYLWGEGEFACDGPICFESHADAAEWLEGFKESQRLRQAKQEISTVGSTPA